MTTNTVFGKSTGGVLDYKFDWKPLTNGTPGGTSDWLAVAETIASHTITATTGITVDSSALTDTNTSVTVWLSGGAAQTAYTVKCNIVTSAARTDERSITVNVWNR